MGWQNVRDTGGTVSISTSRDLPVGSYAFLQPVQEGVGRPAATRGVGERRGALIATVPGGDAPALGLSRRPSELDRVPAWSVLQVGGSVAWIRALRCDRAGCQDASSIGLWVMGWPS